MTNAALYDTIFFSHQIPPCNQNLIIPGQILEEATSGFLLIYAIEFDNITTQLHSVHKAPYMHHSSLE